MRYLKLCIITVLFFLGVLPNVAKETYPRASIAKWFENHAAAISITYDDGGPYSDTNKETNKFVVENGMTMDYELVTYDHIRTPNINKYFLKKVIPIGLGYFGHGHRHINHDELSYTDALKSFKRCFQAMSEMGLKPVAYAYPEGKGLKPETQKALSESGFLSGRLHFSPKMTAPYILSNSEKEPENWFGLPTLVMQDFAYSQCKDCTNNNEELIPYLEETLKRNAWIILTYHAIGDEKGYGFFKRDEFKKNIFSIKERNFWNASMNAVTLYIRERLHANVHLSPSYDFHKKIEALEITVSDSLPNDVYDQPLTVLFTLPKEWVHKTIALEENGQTIKTFVSDSPQAMIHIKPDEIQRKLVPFKIKIKN